MEYNLKKRTKPSPKRKDRGEGREGIIKKEKSEIKLSEIFQTLLTNNICRTIDEVKYNLTIDQVYLFYEKCIKKELEEQRFDAITLANALIYASPSHDNASASRKQRMWNKFINSLDWNKITKPKEKPDPNALISVFGGLGVPSIKGGKK